MNACIFNHRRLCVVKVDEQGERSARTPVFESHFKLSSSYHLSLNTRKDVNP